MATRKKRGSSGSRAVQRLPAEVRFRSEIDALVAAETEEIPPGWQMSPRSVLTYVMGGEVNGQPITAKYIGQRRRVEIAVATLLTDRALLLIGEPGTAKSWLSEHLTAAICRDSTRVIQGTAGTTEDQIRYTWNYAMLIAHGPSEAALIPSPVYRAMVTGSLVRFEEITRCPSEVQDALISILSERRLAVPELGIEVPARRGFSLLATANTRDRGVNELSAALKRRFNIVVLSPPHELLAEVEIVKKRVTERAEHLGLHCSLPSQDAIERVVTIFRELRRGQTLDGKNKLKTPSGVLSTAEAISLFTSSMALAGHFGDGVVGDDEMAAGLLGVVVKDEDQDIRVWKEYLEMVMKKRGAQWRGLYHACSELAG